MMTRNRGKSKSVVEKLGLVRKNKRRGSKDADSAEVSTVLSTALHERSGREAEKEMSRVWSEAGKLAITDDVNAGSQSDREANGFDSAKTTPARWSSYPDKLDVFAIGQPAFINCENELRALRYDWLPPNNFHCFQVCDEILREVMEEISTVGGVYLSRRQFLQSRLRKNGPKENEREDVVHAFREINLQNLFDKMSADMVKMNDDLDEKDIFLASCGLVRPGGMGAEADISLVKSGADVATQEASVLRGSDLRRCARSMLFERKRRRNVLRLACAQSRSRSRSLSESSNDFDGGARCYPRKVAVVRQSHEVGFLAGQRKRRGCFYARPSRAFAAARNAVASTTVGDAEVHMERARALHHRRDLHRRLTLLDRVVLGLTCSVVQDGDEIHIKQLHSDDLSILLQRVTETGFNINGLSTKTNANSEQEFNITLAYHPRGEALVRQVRKRNTSGAQSSPSTTTTTTTMLASNAFRGAQVLSPTSVAAATVGGSAGATGDTVCLDTRSDGESGLKGRELVVCDSPPSLRPSSAMGYNRSRVLSVAARRRAIGATVCALPNDYDGGASGSDDVVDVDRRKRCRGGGDGEGKSVVAGVSRVYSSVAIEAATAEALVESSEKRKLNPVQQRVEPAGLAGTADIDDGADFELSTALNSSATTTTTAAATTATASVDCTLCTDPRLFTRLFLSYAKVRRAPSRNCRCSIDSPHVSIAVHTFIGVDISDDDDVRTTSTMASSTNSVASGESRAAG
ncbi:hypothetical protein ECG_05097 [Echinococcus granulosus]|nr:hypothetical protein ECG_05097 [Echinococcus granulosus]